MVGASTIRAAVVRLYGFPLSLNVERVALALAHKELPTEVVRIDPDDRSLVRTVSGQDLVPVIEDEGTIVYDSTEIILHLERRYPERPLLPSEPARRAELELFLDWFNRVWKRAPNEIYAQRQKAAPDEQRIERWGEIITGSLDRFEALLTGRDYLFGDRLSAADCAAYPFLKYATLDPKDDPYFFHHILRRYEERGAPQPRLEAWIARMSRRPQVAI